MNGALLFVGVYLLKATSTALLKSLATKTSRITTVLEPIAKTAKLTDATDLLSRTDIFIFDCDGVIWRGDTLIDGVSRSLTMLRELGKKIFFVTNNSTKSRKGFLKKFQKLGLAVTPDDILSSSFAAAYYLKKNPLTLGKKVYVIGHEGVEEELRLQNIPFISGTADNCNKVTLDSDVKIDHDEDVAAVIVGFDSAINYYKIQYAQLCINKNVGCQFIATNLDAVTHLTAEQEWAGNGAMVGAIKGCTGQEPIVVGKPSSLLIEYIVQRYPCDKSRICMVGDRLDTDILFGKNNGLQTVLTLSGVTTAEQLFSPANTILPSYYIDSIVDLISAT